MIMSLVSNHPYVFVALCFALGLCIAPALAYAFVREVL